MREDEEAGLPQPAIAKKRLDVEAVFEEWAGDALIFTNDKDRVRSDQDRDKKLKTIDEQYEAE